MNTTYQLSRPISVEVTEEGTFIDVIPTRPAIKLHLQFLGGETNCSVNVVTPSFQPKSINWRVSDESGRPSARVQPPDDFGIRKVEVLASLEAQEHYRLHIAEVNALTHVCALITDASGASRNLGISPIARDNP